MAAMATTATMAARAASARRTRAARESTLAARTARCIATSAALTLLTRGRLAVAGVRAFTRATFALASPGLAVFATALRLLAMVLRARVTATAAFSAAALPATIGRAVRTVRSCFLAARLARSLAGTGPLGI